MIPVVRRRTLIAAVVLIGLSLVLDRWAYEHVVYLRIYDTDGGRLLRILGYWPTWIVAAVALWLNERGVVASARRSALLVAASPAVAGIIAELLKLLLRRERPTAHDGAYVFRPFTERPFSTGGLALPSSHVMVAFGAAAMLAYLFPRARWLWFALACGCALTRVLARAHFVSDVVVAAMAAIATTRWLIRRFGAPDNAGTRRVA
jgi:membrane-associated phospholipid phosphatase